MDEIILKKLENAFKDKNKIALVIESPSRLTETNMEITEYLVKNRGLAGIYVTLNKPYRKLKYLLDAKGVDTERVIFIDAISSERDKEGAGKVKGCLYIDTPQNLTDLGIAIENAMSAISRGKRFLIFDSFSSLSVFHEPNTVNKFARFLCGRMESWGVIGVVLAISAEKDKGMVALLRQFIDTVIDLTAPKEVKS